MQPVAASKVVQTSGLGTPMIQPTWPATQVATKIVHASVWNKTRSGDLGRDKDVRKLIDSLQAPFLGLLPTSPILLIFLSLFGDFWEFGLFLKHPAEDLA